MKDGCWARRRALFLFLLLLPALPAHAYTCFYELSAPQHLATGAAALAGHIDPGSGAYFFDLACNAIHNPGLPLSAEIVYRTQDASLGPFGPGTSCPYDWFVVHSPVWKGHPWMVVGPGNHQYVFEWKQGNGVFADARDPGMIGATFSLTHQSDGVVYILRYRGNLQYQFDFWGGLIQIVDHYGNTVHITRNPVNGFATKVWYGYNQDRCINYIEDAGNNHVTQIKSQWSAPVTLPNPHVPPPPGVGTVRTWTLTYDAASPAGKMINLQDPGYGVVGSPTYQKQYAFTWTAYTRSDGVTIPLVSTITDPRGTVTTALHYDANGRVTSTDTPAGGHHTFVWTVAPTGDFVHVTATDPAGHSYTLYMVWWDYSYGYILYQCNDNTLGEKFYYAHNAPPSHRPDHYLLVTSLVDGRGRAINYNYDPMTWDLTSVSSPRSNGGAATEGWDYDPASIQGTASPRTHGGTATYSYVYDPVYHLRTQVTDPLGRVWKYGVDENGNIASATDPAGNTSTFRYDDQGDLIAAVDSLSHQWTWERDSNGVIIAGTDPANHSCMFDVNDVGLITRTHDSYGDVTDYTYDVLFNKAAVYHYPNQVPVEPCTIGQPDVIPTLNTPAVTAFTYDAARNITAVTDALGHVWSETYDCCGRPLVATDPLGHTHTWTWDSAGRLVSDTDPVGNSMQVVYGMDGRPTSLVFKRPDGTTESHVDYAYDPVSHRTASITDSQTGAISFQYDIVDQLVGLTTPNGSMTYQYDSLGRPTQMAVSGQSPISYVYDPMGNVYSLTQGGQTLTFRYDSLGRLLGQNLPGSVVTEREYDAAGRCDMVRSTKNGVPLDYTTYTYDGTNPNNEHILNVRYVNANGVTSTITPDPLGRIATITNSNGDSYAFSYLPNGLKSAVVKNGVTTAYTYDNANNLMSVGGVPITRDANGNPLTWGGHTYTWNARGQLASYSDPATTLGYSYDGLGNPLTVVNNGVATNNLFSLTTMVAQTTGGAATPILNGPSLGGPIQIGGNFNLANGNGSNTALVDAAGNVVGTTTYTYTGQPTSSGASSPFGYLGYYENVPGFILPGAHPYSTEWGEPFNTQHLMMPNAATTSPVKPNILFVAMDGGGEFPEVAGGGGSGGAGGGGGPAGRVCIGESVPMIDASQTLRAGNVPGNPYGPLTNTETMNGLISPWSSPEYPEPLHVGFGCNKPSSVCGGEHMDSWEFRAFAQAASGDPSIIADAAGSTTPEMAGMNQEVVQAANQISVNLSSVDFNQVWASDPYGDWFDPETGTFTSREIRLCFQDNVLPKTDWYRHQTALPRPQIVHFININPEGAAGVAAGTPSSPYATGEAP